MIERRSHPFVDRMHHPPLNVDDCLAGISFKPKAVERFGYGPELHYQLPGKVLRLDLAALFLP
jgi:hypothetical protein